MQHCPTRQLHRAKNAQREKLRETRTAQRDIAQRRMAAMRTGERVTRPMPIQATVPSVSGTEPVAEFTLTLCLKRQGSKKPNSEPAASG